MTDNMPRRGRGRPRMANPKTRTIRMRCTLEESAALKARAAEAGMEVADYIRDRALTGKIRAARRPRVDLGRLAKASAELRQLGPWLNDLAQSANVGGPPPTEAELGELRVRMRHVKELISQALNLPPDQDASFVQPPSGGDPPPASP